MTSTKRILIADDDEDLAQALASHCRNAGLIVETAFDCVTTLEKFDSFHPDLAILDVNMPSGNGLDVCEMLSRDPILAKIPIIILTGRKDLATRTRCNMIKAHYAAKGSNVWSGLEPLIGKCLKTAKNILPAEIVNPVNRVFAADAEHVTPPKAHLSILTEIKRFVAQEGAAESPTADDLSQERFIDSIFSSIGERAFDGEAEAAPACAPPTLSKPKVLCIDDDAELLNSLKLRLEQHGLEVNQARGGMEGYLDAFLTEMQAIILDYEMPSENGAYTLRRLKENPVTSDIPVIVLTGKKDRSLERTLCNMGATKYLTKPVEWDKLMFELQKHVHLEPQPLPL